MTERNNNNNSQNSSQRTLINFFDKDETSRNWELNLVDPLALDNIKRRCNNHPNDEVYLNVREWTAEYDRHWFVGNDFKNIDFCFDCSQSTLEKLNENEGLARYNLDENNEVKVSKLVHSDERNEIISPYLQSILTRKIDYVKVMKKEKII